MGVVTTFDPLTGDDQPTYRDSGNGEPIRLTAWLAANNFSDRAADVLAALHNGERKHRCLVEVEVSISEGHLSIGLAQKTETNPLAAVRGVIALTAPDRVGLSTKEAVGLITPAEVEQLLHSTFTDDEASSVLVAGMAASPGVAVGAVYFSADDAFEAFMGGQEVILVSQETSPADIHGMEIANGILTTKGGLASHAAVVARGWGIPAVVGLSDISLGSNSFQVGSTEVAEGDVVSLDGSTGEVRIGEVAVSGSEPPDELFTILHWADEIRAGRAKVRANADNAKDALKARQLGAEGIGLCRTEHMFLGERLPIIQRAIVATTEEEKRAALEQLGSMQRIDFVELLEAMDGLPVTVRLLDPPLHEFLPTLADIARAEPDTEDTVTARLHRAAEDWHEANPMLGTRGVRLAVLKPELYKMQTKALAHAISNRIEVGGDPRVEVMIPLVVGRPEIELARSWIEDELTAVLDDRDVQSRIQIGAMIETPRAALRAGEMAAVSDFFSFGTNDLTQMTFGFSRDDVERSLMSRYLELGLLESNPFHTLDEDGVGALIETAATACKHNAGSRQIKLGACGEHGGEPKSISFLLGVGLDYVSCSPYRVPVARLAAAHHFLHAAPKGEH